MTPVLPRSCQWYTRLHYGLLWAGLVAVFTGVAMAVHRTAGLAVAAAVAVAVLWGLSRVGLGADQDHLVVRTVIRARLLPWTDIESFFWRAPRYIGGSSSAGLDTRNARLSLRRKDGTELRLPAIVWSPAGADGVEKALRRWASLAGVPVTPLVTADHRRPG